MGTQAIFPQNLMIVHFVPSQTVIHPDTPSNTIIVNVVSLKSDEYTTLCLPILLTLHVNGITISDVPNTIEIYNI